MAVWATRPSIWARLSFRCNVADDGGSYYPYDRYYRDYFYRNQREGVMAPLLRPDHARVAFNTVEASQYQNPRYTVARTYAVGATAFGENLSTPALWTPSGSGVSQSSLGLTPVNVAAEAVPLWSQTRAGTPTTQPAHAWVGEYSEDGTICASLLRDPGVPGQVYLSVSQNGVTTTPRTALSLTHLEGFLAVDDSRKLEMRLWVRSLTEIWILHVNESSVGAGDRKLFLSVWNGSTISSTTALDLGSYSILAFDLLPGPSTHAHLVYSLYDSAYPYSLEGPVNGRSFVRAIEASSRVVSAVLHTSPVLTDSTNPSRIRNMLLEPGDRLLNNRAFAYKGLNYLVHVFPGHAAVVYTYNTATPLTVTLLRWGFLPFLEGAIDAPWHVMDEEGMHYARATAIEYDPATDTAVLAAVIPVRPWAVPLVPAEKDLTRVYLLRYSEPLDSPSWAMTVQMVDELPSYVFTTGSSTTEQKRVFVMGYIPSRNGVTTQGLLLFTSDKMYNSSYSDIYMHAVRLSNWRVPVDHEGEVALPLSPSVAVTASREYDGEVHVDDTVLSIHAAARRTRTTSWATYWSNETNTSVDGAVAITLPFDVSVAGALAANQFGQVEIDFTDSLVIHVQAQVIQVFPLTVHYWSVGTTFLEEFHSYVNTERAALYGRPPLQIMGYDARSLEVLRGLDVAQRHATHSANARWWAHGSANYPAGWQTFEERLAKVTTLGAENLQLPNGRYEYLPEYIPTAWDVWVSWKGSPGHYANLMKDWDTYSGKPGTAPYMYSSLAFTPGRYPFGSGGGPGFDDYPITYYPPVYTDDPELFALYFVNKFLYVKEAYVEATLQENWQREELYALLLAHSWDSHALSHVATAHLAPYAAPLQVHHTTLFSASVGTAHVALSSSGVIAQCVFETTWSTPLPPSAFTAPYSVLPSLVSSSLTSPWGNDVSAALEAPYDNYGNVQGSLTAPYDQPPSVQGALAAIYGQPIPLQAVHTATYAVRALAATSHECSALLGPPVSRAHVWEYELLQRNPVGARFVVAYTVGGLLPAVTTAPVATAHLNGNVLEVEDGYITCEYDSPGYRFSCSVKNLTFLSGAKQQDVLDVYFEGEHYVFFLSDIVSSSPEKSAAPSVRLEALSPVYQLDAPYAEATTYAPPGAEQFSAIVSTVLGRPVDFSRHVDWLVPFGRAQCTAQTPLAFVRSLMETIGSRLLSEPDGSLYVLPRYPTGMDTLPTGVPALAFSEAENTFSGAYSYEYAKGYNRFRVRDSEASFGDVIEFDQDTYVASVWVSPYSHDWRLACTTTPGVLLSAMGEEVLTYTELLDFQAGAASCKYPILDLVSVDWVTDSLGGVSFTPFSTKVTTPTVTHFGYGLARVTYRARCSKFTLHSSAPLDATQLIIVRF